jgi:putative endonuclease
MHTPFVPAKAGTQEPKAMAFYVYILASRRNGTLYTGMTDDLVRRVWQHRTGAVPGFTNKYGVKMLVWYEQHETRESALIRE